MAVSSASVARDAPIPTTSNTQATTTETPDSKATGPPKTSLDTESLISLSQKDAENVDSAAEFPGELNTDDKLPSMALLRKMESLVVLDRDGKTVPFKDLYNGPNVARRVLVIFIRHFFCGNCQEFIRTLTSSISTTELLSLPTPTFIAIVGCGDASLIPMWQTETSCPFPVYADPTKKLYTELGMLKTLKLGPRPEYQRHGLMTLITGSFVQNLKMIKSGKALKGGGYQQVGGEFMFEPVEASTPIMENPGKQLGLGGPGDIGKGGYIEEKRITWCHRMRTTRDHAEIPELREVLGLDGDGKPGVIRRGGRWL